MSRAAILLLAAVSLLSACKKKEQGPTAVDPDAGVPEAEVKRVIKAARPDMEKCYLEGVARKPDLSGKIVLVFAVGKDGKVDPTRTGMGKAGDPAFAKCVLDILVKLDFPKPGVPTDIEFPMDLGKYVDAGGVAASASASAAASGSASAAASGSASAAPSASASSKK